MKPIVMLSSWPPRKCGIATFAEEAMEFLKKKIPERPHFIISHTDGKGKNVLPIIDMNSSEWHKKVVEKVFELSPEVLHIQHEYVLYNYLDSKGRGDGNERFLKMLEQLKGKVPTVIELHTVHGRLKEFEEEFLRKLSDLSTILLFKCHYQKWRLGWTFSCRNWKIPSNIMVIPHGARPDRRYAIDQVEGLKNELGLDVLKGRRVAGLVGWIQSNKRWDILTGIWKDIHDEILEQTGQDWILLAAGAMRDPAHKWDYRSYRSQVKLLEKKGIAHFFEFIPRGAPYYKGMAICDYIVLPSLDETQSGTLARIIALNKPFITTAPMEGLTAQTLESEGGLLFTNKEMLKKQVLRLSIDESLRWNLGHKLYRYLMEVVSWEIVAGRYREAYEIARTAIETGKDVYIDPEF
ncbi:MAG: hypothetical protein P9M03_05675 [Candidatus Theseobacter exili]|nr:hypothetical protein [Candidatus Theseobacter exili]